MFPLGRPAMSALSQLLDRLRSVSPPPGAAATVVAVPSAGDELTGEVAFLFGDLEALWAQREALVQAARSQAAALETDAVAQRARLLDQARSDAQRQAAGLLAQRGARSERMAAKIVADGVREADGVLARGRERTPALVLQVSARILELEP